MSEQAPLRRLSGPRAAVLLVAGSAVVGLVATVATSSGVPTLYSPYPAACSYLGAIARPWWFATRIIPAAASLLVSCVLMLGGKRCYDALGVAFACGTIGSIVYFGLRLRDGLVNQGAVYLAGTLSMNAIALVILWWLWLRWRGTSGAAQRLVLAVLACTWLFGIAFPWLGEVI